MLIGERSLSNLLFADDIDSMAGSKSELQSHPDKLAAKTSGVGREISPDKNKVIVSFT